MLRKSHLKINHAQLVEEPSFEGIEDDARKRLNRIDERQDLSSIR